MADFQFYASETVINHKFEWKLKRPDSALSMLPGNDANYEIINVRASDEGSYFCTFNTNTNQGVPGDNTLCLITLGTTLHFSISLLLSVLSSLCVSV